jgi:hypothetical protein
MKENEEDFILGQLDDVVQCLQLELRQVCGDELPTYRIAIDVVFGLGRFN